MFVLTLKGTHTTRIVVGCEGTAQRISQFITGELFPVMEGGRALTYQTDMRFVSASDIVQGRSSEETHRVDELMDAMLGKVAVADIKDSF